jgi:arylformamidase
VAEEGADIIVIDIWRPVDTITSARPPPRCGSSRAEQLRDCEKDHSDANDNDRRGCASRGQGNPSATNSPTARTGDTMLDVTVALRPGYVPLYPDDTPLELEHVQSLAAGDPRTVSRLQCSVHAGTHVDGPAHYLRGAPGVEAVPLDALIGRCWVADATGIEHHIDVAALNRLTVPDDAERILFRTRNSRLWDDPHFTPDFLAVREDAAEALVQRGVRLVGIDGLSIAPYAEQTPTHVTLLRSGVAVVETLDLRRAEQGWYELICLPLLMPGADGAPARAVLAPG